VPDFLLKTNTIGGFAEFAAGASPGNKAFSGGAAASGGFFGLIVKDDFFSKNLNKQSTSGTEENADDSETVNDDNYDPQYDPIISLPDEIEVSTGEEEEEKLFGERAKLYRYDVKLREWKERGEILGK
jgi:E3 SUMO-protein ligase RanBP2